MSSGRGCSSRESVYPSLQLQLLTQGYFPPPSATLHFVVLEDRFCGNPCPQPGLEAEKIAKGFVLRRRLPAGRKECWPHLLGPPPPAAWDGVCTDALGGRNTVLALHCVIYGGQTQR